MICSSSTAPNHDSLRVVRQGHFRKSKRFHLVTGLAPDINFSIYNNTIDTLERAIKERVYYVSGEFGFEAPPRPARDAFSALSKISEHYRKEVRYSTPLSSEQFVNCYQGRKRTIYQNAYESLLRHPVERKDSEIKAFVKMEKYNFTAKPNAVPRVIQPRDPRYGLSLGRYIKPIEKHVYKMIDTLWGSQTVMKGLNMSQRGQVIQEHWSAFVNPVAIGLDASRFDQHVSYDALVWEHSIYKMYYPHDKELPKLLSWQLHNTGKGYCSDGRLKYKVRGNRMSGDMNTGLGNVLIMASMVYGYCQSVSVNARLVNDGDDCVVFMEQRDVAKFSQGLDKYCRNLGFNVIAEKPVYQLEEVVFCQAQPVTDGTGYVMIRDPRIAISKDCTILTHLPTEKVFRRWMASVGTGGVAMTGGFPVMQEFYSVFVRGSKGLKPLEHLALQAGVMIMGKGMSRLTTPPTTEARVSFYRAFKITPEAQIQIELTYQATELQFKSTGVERLHLPM